MFFSTSTKLSMVFWALELFYFSLQNRWLSLPGKFDGNEEIISGHTEPTPSPLIKHCLPPGAHRLGYFIWSVPSNLLAVYFVDTVYKFLQATDKYIANREYVCRCYIYLNYVSVFYTSILCFTVILPLLIIFPLHEYPNVVVLCGLRDMEAHTVEFIDSDTCHFLRREVFHKMNASSTPEVPLVAYP
jgi:hypothetical protein